MEKKEVLCSLETCSRRLKGVCSEPDKINLECCKYIPLRCSNTECQSNQGGFCSHCIAKYEMFKGTGKCTGHALHVTIERVLSRVHEELRRANEKFPDFKSPHEGYAILKEEVDELWDDIKANRIEASFDEAVQVAAMAVKYLTSLMKTK